MRDINKRIQKALMYILVIVICFILISPLVMLLSYSFRTRSEIITTDMHFFTKKPTISAYKNMFTHKIGGSSFLTWLKNSLLICVVSTIIATYASALGGYGFVRYRFPGRRLFFFAIFFSQLMPWMVLLLPYYALLVKIKGLDSLWSLGLLYLTISVPLSTWLFIGFFKNHPKSLEEAAMCDGCSVFGVFHRIVLPLVAPSLTAIALFSFIVGWGDFLFSSVIISSVKNFTLPLALIGLKGEYEILWPEILVMASIMTVPVVVLFLVMQKYIVYALAGGIKE